MTRQDTAKEIEHFKKTDWYRLESSDNLDESSLESSVKDIIAKTGINSKTKILEIACGGGQFGLALIKKTGASYWGLDLIPELVKDAQKRAKQRSLKAEFMVGDAHKLPFASGSFDVVFVTYSLHHFPQESLDDVSAEAYRVLKAGGYYYALEPNGLNPIMLKWWLLNSPERLLPLGKRWRENRDLSVNETIVYPWQIARSVKKEFGKVRVYSIGFIPKGRGPFKKNPEFWDKINYLFGKIPLLNKIGGSFVVIGQK